MTKPHITSSLKRPFRKLFIVGLDGSDLSLQAVRFAAQLADEYRDNLLIVTLAKETDDKQNFERHEAKAKQIAMHYGTPHMRIASECIQVPLEWDYGDALTYIGNHAENGSAVVVLGAAGKGDMERAGMRPSGQPPMGSVAAAVMQMSKVPVLLVKNGPSVANFESVLRSKTRIGRSGKKGLRMMACIDGKNALARSALDTAALFLRKGDSLYALHVLNTDKANEHGVMVELNELEQEFGPECDKLADALKLETAELVKVRKSTKSIKEHIEASMEEMQIDVLMMGSAELSNPAKVSANKHYLGSVASAVSKTCSSHVVIVKSFPTTVGGNAPA